MEDGNRLWRPVTSYWNPTVSKPYSQCFVPYILRCFCVVDLLRIPASILSTGWGTCYICGWLQSGAVPISQLVRHGPTIGFRVSLACSSMSWLRVCLRRTFGLASGEMKQSEGLSISGDSEDALHVAQPHPTTTLKCCGTYCHSIMFSYLLQRNTNGKLLFCF